MAGHLKINLPEAAKHLAKRVDRVFGTHRVAPDKVDRFGVGRLGRGRPLGALSFLRVHSDSPTHLSRNTLLSAWWGVGRTVVQRRSWVHDDILPLGSWRRPKRSARFRSTRRPETLAHAEGTPEECATCRSTAGRRVHPSRSRRPSRSVPRSGSGAAAGRNAPSTGPRRGGANPGRGRFVTRSRRDIGTTSYRRVISLASACLVLERGKECTRSGCWTPSMIRSTYPL
jgi:hypothetical protein